MTALSEPPEALVDLFERSPADQPRTSAAAEVGFVLGVLALLLVLFELTTGLAVGCAAVALVCSVLGLARASRPHTSGGILAAVGLVTCLAAGALVALRYVGIDTTVGDALVPAITDALQWLTSQLPPS